MNTYRCSSKADQGPTGRQNSSKNAHVITFYVSDLLMRNGEDIRAQPLENRRELLRSKVMPILPAIRYSNNFAVTAEEMVAAVRSQGLEDVVAKRRDSRYELGQCSGAWVKMSIGGRQEFAIAGYTPSPKSFDALPVGHYRGDKPIFVARVRNGFVPTIRTVFRHVKSLRTNKCRFSNLPESKKDRCGEGLTAEAGGDGRTPHRSRLQVYWQLLSTVTKRPGEDDLEWTS